MSDRFFPAEHANFIVRATVIVAALVGLVLFVANLSLIDRALYDYGIWAVPLIGAVAGLILFGFIWGGSPFVHKYMTESE
jgi:hypothetical protein